MLGTIVNGMVIIIGGIIGLLVKGKISKNVSLTVMNGLALCVLYIGISGALKAQEPLIIIISIAIGAAIGEILDLDRGISSLGKWVEKKVKNSGETGTISEGFVTASLLFCVGAMAIVGALESGLQGNHTTLYAKSILDGVSSIIFASTLGIGVILSSITVFVYQGLITLGAGMLSGVLNNIVIDNISAIGSILIIGLAFNVLGITKIKVANLLPAVFIPIIFGLFS